MLLFSGSAQVNKSIKPISESLLEGLLPPVSEIVLPKFNMQEISQLDFTDAKNGELPKFSRSIFTDITLDNSGSWTALPNGDRLWRVSVISFGAQALLPYFNKFYLPPGSSLHIYNPDKSAVIGAFTSVNNPKDGHYATGLIHGESAVLEYYEPVEVKGRGIISLNEIGHAYRWVNKYFPKSGSRNDTLGFNESGSCEVNINCSEGTAWQSQKRSVVCIIVQSSLGQGVCTGTLMNTVRQDCTPYLLSAQHCSEGVSSNQYGQFLFYFNFESPGCNDPSAIGNLDNDFMVGCTKISDSNDNGGETGSDFLLLQLESSPPDNFNIYYSGWNNLDFPSHSGVSIHHPQADIKKVSTYTSTLVSTTWDFPSSVHDTHWEVRWSATPNGHGVTEEGSSGCPLFNTQGQLIGTLTGGYSFCNSPDSADQFGKFAYDWTSNGSSANRQLKPWLDPDNTGANFIDGRNADCVVGIEDLNRDVITIEVYPNPSSGILNLSLPADGGKIIHVFDVLSGIIFEAETAEKSFIVDLSFVRNGIYILQVEALNGHAFKKIVLNNY